MRAILHWLETHPKPIVLAFFACLFLIGSLAYRDYGVSWDEPSAFQTGEIAYQYVANGIPYPSPQEFQNRSYGTVFDLPVSAMVHAFGLFDARSALLLKHFMTFFVFFLATVVFYLLCKRHFRSPWMGLLGAVFLITSPRMFAEAFYNPKDIPHLSFFLFAMFTLTRFLEEKNGKWACIHALVCALATGIRLTSMIIPVLTLFFLSLHAVHAWRMQGERPGKSIAMGVVFFVGWIALTYAVWPFLWEDPIGHFLEAYRRMTSYSPEGFYMGQRISTLPWHYVPVWIAITAPLLYSFFFIAGFASLVRHARHPLRFLLQHTNEAIAACWFFLPILAVYVSSAGLYDTWRHLYFIYPGFLLIALIGVRALMHTLRQARGGAESGAWLPRAFAGAILLHTLWISGWMVRYHPVQSSYFSIPARFVQHNFELDYWGLSFRPAFERVLAMDPSPLIPIWASSSPAYSTLAILPEEQRSRIVMVEETQAKYALNNYRSSGYDQNYPHEEIDRIMAGGVKVLGIYKLW